MSHDCTFTVSFAGSMSAVHSRMTNRQPGDRRRNWDPNARQRLQELEDQWQHRDRLIKSIDEQLRSERSVSSQSEPKHNE
jgi:hypothetical protein